MKNLLLLFLAGTTSCLSVAAQDQARVMSDRDGSKMLVGILTRESLSGDTAFAWYAPNAQDYKPYPKAVATLRKYKDSINLVVFMGTWCHDSQFVVPRLFRLLDAAGFPANRVSLLAVTRDNHTPGNLAEALHLEHTPTIIVMKQGRELGRVVEYGPQGMFDKALGEIIEPPESTRQDP